MNELLAAAIRQWVPLAFATTAGVVSERSGIVNIALEGMMLAGAFASVAGAQATGNPLLGLITGLIAGALVGLLHAAITQGLRVPHILSGVGINLGILGLTTYGLRLYGDRGLETSRTLESLLPQSLGPALRSLIILIPPALAVGLTWLVLSKTPLGLRLRACGESPGAARSAGINVLRLRYGAVIVSGALAGTGGAALALTSLGTFTENMTAGRGYVALAAVIFGRWNPLGAAATAFFFALGDAVQIALQTAGLANRIPPDLLSLLPYVLTLVALGTISAKNVAPSALGNPDA